MLINCSEPQCKLENRECGKNHPNFVRERLPTCPIITYDQLLCATESFLFISIFRGEKNKTAWSSRSPSHASLPKYPPQANTSSGAKLGNFITMSESVSECHTEPILEDLKI